MSPTVLGPLLYDAIDQRDRLLLVERNVIAPSFDDACALLGLEVDDVFAKHGIPWQLGDSDDAKALRAPFIAAGARIYRGCGVVELRNDDDELVELLTFANLITQVGDQYYGERASGISSPPAQVTGMQLGTGTTAVAKTGAGAAIVTYVSGSAQAIDGSFPTSALSGSSRRIQWKNTYAAGTATASGIAEATLINQAVATNSGAAAAATIARFLLSPTVNKGANDSLAVTWNNDLLGA